MERLFKKGIILKRPYLSDRLLISRKEVSHLNTVEGDIKLVDLNTSIPSNFTFEKEINDETKGTQRIRVVKTTKPYNPDFIMSAQTLTYIFPDSPSQAITTPLEGDIKTWMEFLKVNRKLIEVMMDSYSKKGLGNFVVATGINFSPYSHADFLKTQTIKSAHLHAFIISQKLLDEVSFFSSRAELRKMHELAGSSQADIEKDLRRFFAGPIHRLFSSVVLGFIEEKLTESGINASNNVIADNDSGTFPLSAIVFDAKGTESLDSHKFFEFIRTSYEATERFYREMLMPIFTSNYEEVISGNSDSEKLEYNDLDKALDILNNKIHSLPRAFSQNKKRQIELLVRRIVSRLDKNKDETFCLWPCCGIYCGCRTRF